MTPLFIPVIGDDLRFFYLAEALKAQGLYAGYYKESELGDRTSLGDFSVAILPLFPSEKLIHKILKKNSGQALLCAGLPSKDAILLANEYNFSVYDYMKDPCVVIQNAVATAEGAIAKALSLSPVTLQNSRILVIGYGRCGEILSQKCHALCGDVSVCETGSLAIARAKAHGFPVFPAPEALQDYDLIFNTAPYLTLTASRLKTVKPDTVLIDIASAPGGTDFSYCEKNNIHAFLCPSLPAVYAPKTSGEILASAIMKRISTLKF